MSIERKYTFGPVPSRRLGLSLGVDVIPKKLCTLDCVYCEVGKTDKRGLARKEYLPAKDIIEEVKQVVSEYPNLDYITISGSGEPTLNSKLAEIISGVKSYTQIPIAVLTNGTLLYLPEVRKDLLLADVVSPSLDAVSQDVFNKIDLPNPKLKIEEIINGIKTFRKEYSGQLWIEVLFVKDLNDTEDEVQKLKQVIDQINPDKIHINTVVRPPAYSFAMPTNYKRLEEIKKIFGEKSEIIGGYKDVNQRTNQNHVNSQSVLALLIRRAMTKEEMVQSLEINDSDLNNILIDLISHGQVRSYIYQGKTFYQCS